MALSFLPPPPSLGLSPCHRPRNAAGPPHFLRGGGKNRRKGSRRRATVEIRSLRRALSFAASLLRSPPDPMDVLLLLLHNGSGRGGGRRGGFQGGVGGWWWWKGGGEAVWLLISLSTAAAISLAVGKDLGTRVLAPTFPGAKRGRAWSRRRGNVAVFLGLALGLLVWKGVGRI